MKSLFLFLILAASLMPSYAVAQEGINIGKSLDVERCIEIALKQHPSILAAVGALRVVESRLGQARAGYYPQLSASASYSRIYPYSTTSGRTSAAAGSAYDSTNSSVTISQNIFDFGKTSTQVRIQNLNLNASRSDFNNITNQVVFGVKQAYYSLLRARRNQEVAGEVVEQYRRYLSRAKSFFEIGVKPKFDVTKAEVDFSNAKLNLLKTENAARLAQASLNNAMGLTDVLDYEIKDNLAFESFEINLEAALKQAYDRRPDLKAISEKKKALEETVSLQKKGYYPYLTGAAGYGWGGDSFPPNQGWNVGATLNIPLFSGLSTKYQVEEANANLAVLKANEESLRQAIYLEIKQAWLNLQEAASRIAASEVVVRQAEENLELANGRYASGVGNPMEVTDALVAHANAKTAYIAALYDYRLSQATMEKAIGAK